MIAPPWTPRTVRVGGLELRVVRHGQGPPLLLITGIGANLDMWGPFVRLLSGHELVAFDAPGTGRSQRPRRPLRLPALARIVVELLDALGLERVDVLGYSFGGGLAQELAHRAPERVRRLILCATAPGLGSVPPRPVPALLVATPARYYHPALARFIVPRLAGGRTAREAGSLDRDVAARLAAPPDLLGYAFQLYATAGWTSLRWLHTLPHRTLVLAGDDDRLVPVANARLLARRIPDARLHVVRGGGHLFLVDDPEEPARVIQAFLDE